MKILEELYYTKEHDWIKVDGNIAMIGITDKAQNLLGDIVYIELPEEDDEIAKGESYGVVESVKAATDLLAPISGEVIEINEEVVDEPEKVNEDAYENWFIKVSIEDKEQLNKLLSAKEYTEFCNKEE
jgi:glycine cleavage system H protein